MTYTDIHQESYSTAEPQSRLLYGSNDKPLFKDSFYPKPFFASHSEDFHSQRMHWNILVFLIQLTSRAFATASRIHLYTAQNSLLPSTAPDTLCFAHTFALLLKHLVAIAKWQQMAKQY